MTVQEMLGYLGQASLIRLINLRSVRTSQTLDQKRVTLAYSYKGNVEQLISDLRREDLINILEKGVTFKGDDYYIRNLSTMRVNEIRKLAIDIFCNQIKSEKLVPFSSDSNIDLYSTKYSQKDIYSLNVDVLQEALKGSKEIYVASAYYDLAFFKKLFSQSTSNLFKKIHIIFNGLSGQRLKEQKSDLTELLGILKKYSRKCEIRLKMEQGIFHTKLYIFEGRTSTTFVGSMNSTNAGLLNNEEILIKLSGDKVSFKKYFDQIWTLSTPFNDAEEPKAKNLIAFFRMGILYFKPEYQFQFSYNPFSLLLSEFSNEDKSKLVDPIPNSEAETGIGPFSIFRALNIDYHLSKEEKSRATIKPYCIETTLGYWVPSFFKKEFEDKLEGSTEVKAERYEALQKKILIIDKKVILKKYHFYRDTVKALLKRAKVPYQKYIDKINKDKPNFPYNPFKNDSGYNNFFNKFYARLNDSDYIKKLCIRFYPGPLPEIWEDYAAYKDFKESFFDYLEFIELQEISRRIPKIILKEIEPIQINENPETRSEESDVEQKLSLYLRKFGWDENNWC